jgi:hypothetical protein
MECIPVRSGHEMLTHYFSSTGGLGVVSIKNGSEHVLSTHYFSGSGWPRAVSINSAPEHVTPNLFFASGRSCGSRSAFHCVRGTKC